MWSPFMKVCIPFVFKFYTIQYNTYLIDHSPLGLFSANLKQSTKQQNTTTTTTVKNPNWPEANQLAIYKCSREVEPGTTRNKFSEWLGWVLNTGSPDLKASALTTGPHCLHALPPPHCLHSLRKYLRYAV